MEEKSSYKDILKSVGVLGSVQVAKLFFGLIQNKVLALIVGASGFGIWGLFNSYVTLTGAFAALGTDQASVKQIAANSDDKQLLGKTLFTSRIVLFGLTSLFCLILLLLRNPICDLLFGNKLYIIGIIVTTFAIWFYSINQGNIGVLNGFRDIKGIAKSQIFGVIAGALISFIFVVWLGEKGIPLFILSTYFVTFCFSEFLVRKKIFTIRPTRKEFLINSKELIIIGTGLSYSAIIVSLSNYLVQILLRKAYGLELLGIYNASFTLSNVYVGMILTALTYDFFPRLSKVINDDKETNLIINKQTEVSVLLSSIGIIVLLLLSEVLFYLLYSSEFIYGTNFLRWQILGVSLRVLSFPLGYVLLLRKKIAKYVLCQSIMWFGNYFLLFAITKFLPKEYIGLNYFIAYIVYICFLIYFNKSFFRPSKQLYIIFAVTWIGIIASWCVTVFCSNMILKIILGIFISIIFILFILYWMKFELDIDIKTLTHKLLKKK